VPDPRRGTVDEVERGAAGEQDGRAGPACARRCSSDRRWTWPPGHSCRSVGELTESAERVGSVDVEHRPTAGDRGVLPARKPG
jgi:hypothetical protein